jgi:hypothetical protein
VKILASASFSPYKTISRGKRRYLALFRIFQRSSVRKETKDYISQITMFATRTTSRALFAAGRGRDQCLRTSFAPLPAAPSRALLSTTARTHLPTASSSNRRILGPGRGRLFAPSRRMFSATTVALHGHIDTPKPGEEYVKPCEA